MARVVDCVHIHNLWGDEMCIWWIEWKRYHVVVDGKTEENVQCVFQVYWLAIDAQKAPAWVCVNIISFNTLCSVNIHDMMKGM